jgi:hypothetical protein
MPAIAGTFGSGNIWGSHDYRLAWDGDVSTYADAGGSTFSTGAYFEFPISVKSFYFFQEQIMTPMGG